MNKKNKKVVATLLSTTTVMTGVLGNALPVYAKDDTARLTITYHYDTEDGKMIAKPYNAIMPIGSDYNIESPKLENYILKDTEQTIIKGTINQDTNINVIYTQKEMKTYIVDTTDELKSVITEINSSDLENITIKLNNDITWDSEYIGINGKNIVFDSDSNTTRNISIDTGNKNLRLSGNVTFENVKLNNVSNVYAHGNRIEFGNRYSGTGLSVYGGADIDLDLSKKDVKSTHVIIRGGKFTKVVGGNTDIFPTVTNDFTDYSNPETNKHTTLIGDTRIDIYGGAIGTHTIMLDYPVYPNMIIGGGYGSDTKGSTYLNIYGFSEDDNSSFTKRINQIIGGGFGLSGDQNDTTVDDDRVKHTGNIYGNTNLNIQGGNIPTFFAGGYHNGSKDKKGVNYSKDRVHQRQFHRDKVAVVFGDTNVFVGGDANLYGSEGWYGGSLASTIKGNVNFTIADNAKAAVSPNAYTPSSMNEFYQDAKGQYDYGGENSIFGAGQFDIIEGVVNITVNGGYIYYLNILPLVKDMNGKLDGVASTEIRNIRNEDSAANLTINGGMLADVRGDYMSRKGFSNEGNSQINGDIDISVHGGQIYYLLGYDGRNDSFADKYSVNIDLYESTVYNVQGIYKLNTANQKGINANLRYHSNSDTGYIEDFNDIKFEDKADVKIDAVNVAKLFTLSDDKAYSKLPFYNVHDVSLSKLTKVDICKNDTNILGDLINDNGQLIANGKVHVYGNIEASEGVTFFARPSLIEQNANWKNAEIRLPYVGDNNYNGTTVKDIALTIDGQSEGSANVTIVDKDDHAKMITPKEKDNYILSNGNKNPESNSEIVYYLNNGKDEGLYLKSVDDLAEVKHNNMWQVAKQDETTWYYEVYYQNPDGSFELWKDAQGGQSMPDATVSISHESFDGEDLGWGEVLGEHYVFDETNSNNRLSAKAGEANEGNPLRIYYRCAPHTITYKFEGDVPAGVTPPQTTETWYSAEVEIPDVSKVEGYEFLGWQVVSPDDAEIVDGVLTMPNDDVVVKGVWKVNRYSVSYRFESSDEDRKLPEEIQKLKPADEEDAIKYGQTATPSKASFNDVEDKENDGVWKFKGWKPEKVDNVSSDVEFIGIWEFTPNTHKVNYEFVSGTEGMELPEAFDRYLPEDTNQYVKGDKVKAKSLSVDYVSVEDGAWVFSYEEGTGWDANEKTVGSEDITFTGTWKYIENAYYVDYKFVSDKGQDLPQAIKDMLPQEYAIRPGETAKVKNNSFQNVDVSDAGSWIFLGWDKTEVKDVHDNVTFKGRWKYYEKQTVIGENLVVYEGGLGSNNSTTTGNALPEPQWSSQIGNYTVTVDGKPWDISKQGLPFAWEYRNEKGNKVESSAKIGVYGLYVFPMTGYEDKNVIVNDKLLTLPKEGLKVSEVSVRDVTDNENADNLSTETFKNVYNYESPLEEKKDSILARIYKGFMSLFNSDSAVNGEFNEHGTQDSTCDDTVPHAHVHEGTKFLKNGKEEYPVNKNAKIGLLWDNLIPEVLGEYEDALHRKSIDVIEKENSDLFNENKEIHTMFKYIDPVDMNDGNVWVGTLKNDLTVYVPYSELGKDADKDDRIAVTYYDGLTRDYTINMDDADMDGEISRSNAHFIPVTKTDTGILFDVPTKQFGPFEFLWQEDYYSVGYEFESSDESMTLPEEVIELTPQDKEIYKAGSEVKAIMPKQSEVKVENGIWRFDGYDADAKTANGNITFTGTWTFEISKYTVDYKFQSITEGKDIPEEVNRLVPSKQTYEHGDMAAIVSLEQTTVEVEDGRWVFVGYDRKDTNIPVTSDMTIIGYWRFDGNASKLNNIPVITASDRIFTVGDEFNDAIALKDVTAYDEEDGDVTASLEVVDHNVDTSTAGTYYITYKATDSQGASSTKTVNVFVYPTLTDINNIPVISAEDKELNVGDTFDPRKDVTATDKEDGDLTDVIEIIKNTVDTSKAGTYHVTYKVTDKDGASSVKTIKVVVKDKEVILESSPEEPTKPEYKPEVPQNPEQSERPSEKLEAGTPETGDRSDILVWSSLTALVGVILGVLSIRRKRND